AAAAREDRVLLGSAKAVGQVGAACRPMDFGALPMIEVNLSGLEQVKAKLDKLPQRLAYNAMRRSLRRGANVIRDAARANAKRIDDPETREQIWENIAVASGGSRRERSAGGPMMRVGVLGGAKNYRNKSGTYHVGGSKNNPGGDTWYWRLLEFGTSNMAAQPFMRPAAREAAVPALNAIAAA